MRATWIEPEPIHVTPELRAAVGGHPIVSEILARRGLTSAEAALAFLDWRRYAPAPPTHIPGVEAAVERLARAAQAGESVIVWGDFDVDGQTATAILLTCFGQIGLRTSFYIPHRGEESHGLNRVALEEVLKDGARLLVTCDCGVSDSAELEYCRERGIEVIVTDHHDLPAAGVPAPFVVDPKMLASDHPLYNLCGAGVAYMLAAAVLTRFGRGRLADDLLDLAALGTIADVVPLLADNRFLVQRGLPLLAAGRRVGLAALAQMINAPLSETDADSIAYELAPALNAAGRLANADIAVRLLLTRDRREGDDLAAQIVALNEERRYQTRLVERMALDMIEKLARPLPPALILAHRDWHPGITGIVAGRLTEMFHRPAILISLPETGVARGSARSVAGIDVHQAIAQQRDLLVAEGGHPMAAGFGVLPQNLDEFRSRLLQSIAAQTPAERPGRVIRLDGWIPWVDLTLELYDNLNRLAPFGEGNRPPILAARELTLIGMQSLGERNEDWRLKLRDNDGFEQEVIWWRGDRALIPRGPLDIAFTLRSNVYNGARRLQITLLDLRRSPAAALEPASGETSIQILDQRAVSDPPAALREWLALASEDKGIVCWGEGRAAKAWAGLRRRDQLIPAPTLVIWTIPPGPDELRAALARSGAARLVLLFGDQPEPELRGFMNDLAGLVRFTANRREGQASLDALAGVLAARRAAVLAGLKLLSEVGFCNYTLIGPDSVAVRLNADAPPGPGDISDRPTAAELRRVLEEMAAYRRYMRRADATQALPAGYIAQTWATSERK